MGYKYYYDEKKKLKVIDVSGKKTLKQLNKEFDADLKDITEQEVKANAEFENEEKEKDDKLNALVKEKLKKLDEEKK